MVEDSKRRMVGVPDLKAYYGMDEVTPNYSGFAVIGAGLPRTATMSLRAALTKLLDGPCYHMMSVALGNEVRQIMIPQSS